MAIGSRGRWRLVLVLLGLLFLGTLGVLGTAALLFMGHVRGLHPGVSASELPGTYVADYRFATETLVLEEGGRFVQTVKVKADGRVATTEGRWDFDPRSQRITLSKRMMVVDAYEKFVADFDDPAKKGTSIIPVLRSWGFWGVQIGDYPGEVYAKQ